MGAKIKLTDGFSSPVSAMTQATRQFRQTVDASSNAIAGLGTRTAVATGEMSAFTASSRAAMLSTKGLVAGMAGATAATLGLGNAMQIVAGLLTVKFLYDWLIKSNEQMEVFENTLTVVMKDATKAHETLQWATKFAADTPFEIPEIVEATTKLTTYGFTAQKVLGTVGDMASVMGKPLMQAVEAVADAQTGEIERLKEFGITKDMITKKSQELGVTAVDKGGSITDLTAFNAALFAIMEERYKGGMEMQSHTFKGLRSNLADFIGTVGREMGKPIFDQFKAEAEGALAFIQQFRDAGGMEKMAAGAGKFAEALVVVFNWAGQVFQRLIIFAGLLWPYVAPIFDFLINAGIPLVIAGLAWLGDMVLQVADFFINNWSWLEPLIISVGTAVGVYFVTQLDYAAARVRIMAQVTRAWAAAQAVFNAVMALNPMYLVAIGIGLLIGGIILLVRHWDTVKAAMLNFARDALAAIITVIRFLFPVIGEFIMYVLRNWDSIKAGLIAAWDGVVGYFTSLWASIVAVFNAAVMPVVIAVQNVWAGITGFFAGIWDSVYQWGANIIDTMIQGIISAKDRLVNAFTETFAEVRRLMPFSDAKEGPFSQLTYSGMALMTTFGDGVRANAGSLRDAVGGAFAGAGVTVAANPGGNVGGSTATKAPISIGTLIGSLVLPATGDDNPEAFAERVITIVYEALSEAEAIAANGDMEALL